MSREVDARIRRFDEVLDRLPGGVARGITGRRIQRTVTNAGRRARRGVIVVAIELLTLLAYSLFIGPVGVVGFALAVLLIPLLFIIAASLPLRNADVAPDELKKTPPAQLPRRAEIWLDARRDQLPRLAAPTLDRISAQLNTLGPQLAAVPEMNPVAQDVGRLLNTHLPELVERYTKVPPAMRTAPDADGGPSIEKRLVEGLKTVDAELARASEALAAGDRDAFLIQGKFLENRYNPENVSEPRQ